MAWVETTLGDLVTLQRGFDLPTKDRVPGKVPVLSAGEKLSSHNEAKVPGPGFVIGRSSNLGVPRWSDEDFWPLNTTLFAKDFKGNNPRWLFYLFKTLDLTGFNSGTAQASLNRNYINGFKVTAPGRPEQDLIVGILGSLDDKIAANHRVIRVSIELAESLVTRNLTAGYTRLSEVAKVTMGTSPKGEFLSEEITGLPFYQGVRDFGEITPQQRIYTDNPVREAAAGDILFAVRAPVGEVNIASEHTAIGRGLAAIRGMKNHNALFYLLRSRPEIWNTHQDSGTVFASINKTDLANAPIPEVEMNSTDAALLDELHREALSLTSQNITLAKTRDELLPLLMSGKITVREAGQEAAAAGAKIPSKENEV